MKLFPISTLLIFFIIASLIQAVYSIFFLPAFILILAMAVLTIIISKFFLKKDWIKSLVTTISITQISWALLFMPSGALGYLIHSAILLIILYIIWDIFKNQFKLNFRKIVINNLLFGTVLIILLLITSQWSPV
ncbi:hypothetical protein CL633_02240 [bacterium]|nr:hypothetical protein [bacterium]|tara:strand:- start:7831 stop:8232 length:402 start_codon:yes stop_codon:yes gene_type:complete